METSVQLHLGAKLIFSTFSNKACGMISIQHKTCVRSHVLAGPPVGTELGEERNHFSYIYHFNWLLLSFVPLWCPLTTNVQVAVVTPRKKKIVVLNEIFFYVWVFKYLHEANFYPLLIRMGRRPCEWCDQLWPSTPEQRLNIHVQLLLWWNNWFEQFEKAMMSNVQRD